MHVSAKEFKALGGKKLLHENIAAVMAGIEAKQWLWCGKNASFAGFEYKKGLVHFSCIWPAEGGGAGWRRVKIPLKIILAATGVELTDLEFNLEAVI